MRTLPLLLALLAPATLGGCAALQSATGPCARQTLGGLALGAAGGYFVSDAAGGNGRVKTAGTMAGAVAGGGAGLYLCQQAMRQREELDARFAALEQSNAALRRRVATAETRPDAQDTWRDDDATVVGDAPPSGDIPGGGYVEIGQVEVLENRIVRVPIGGTLAFPSGSAQPSDAMKAVLDELAASLVASPNSVVQIQGHTDNVGSDHTNQLLSEDRAHAVSDYLAARGVDPARIEAFGYGETTPVDTNSTSAGRMRNRRIEVLIAPTQA
ncbi:OmpA family protein [Rubrivirga sp. IMCC43871]|uniref:OmpA family protein n=1 Tax=Rubrivirga sp. IMCC43871 TaxID=3391575 RepID=UPI00398FE39E